MGNIWNPNNMGFNNEAVMEKIVKLLKGAIKGTVEYTLKEWEKHKKY